MTDDRSGFLDRWSRLKQQAAVERDQKASPAQQPDIDSPARAVPPGEAQPPPAEDEPVDVSKLPDIDSLGPESDYTVFMRKGVPDDLRRKALRRMWVTDATISGPDLLEMNALDYTGLEGPQPLTITPPQAALAFLRQAKKLVDRAAGSEPAPPAADSSPGDTAANDANEPPDENSRG